MKRILIAMSALAIAGAALTSANAQGVGVQVGPFGAGVGVGPYYGYHHRYWHDYAYAGECRVIRERIMTPSGNVILRSRRVCD
ncbi:MAG TPA: hypothetical protein VKG24_13530 [Pseudolabrys sp.]|nr:hypothetical protein [Pseudolabrys sp.]